MSIKEKARRALLDFLRIHPAQDTPIDLQESFGFAADVIQNRLWYRGDAAELSQFYKQFAHSGTDDTAQTRFWCQVPEIGSLRKAHDGLPAVMVDTLAHIVKADLDDIDFADDGAASRWAEIADETDFPALVHQAITETLVTGDGAFKLSIDPDVSGHPLIEFWAADHVEYEVARGRITAVIFVSQHTAAGAQYTLRERYGVGTVSYELTDKDGAPCPLTDVPALAQLHDISFDGDFMLAVPLQFFRSGRWPNRGRSLYSCKTDAFDMLDEIVSQWLDAIRAGRVMRYIPERLIPRNPENGALTSLSYFKSNFIVTDTALTESGSPPTVEMQQADIRYDAFVASYGAAVDRCLQGVMSPATLGIDVGKMSSADAQREKKDVTGFTRNAITDALEKVLPKLAETALLADDLMHGAVLGVYDATVSFGEYGAPDFDSRVETLAKASTASLMSVEAAVDELWGGSKDDDWKETEVQRIKQLRGIADGAEPAVGGELIADVEADRAVVRADGTGADRQPETESDAAQIVGTR